MERWPLPYFTCYGLDCVTPSPEFLSEAQPPSLTVLGERVLREELRLNEVMRVGPDPVGLIFLRKEEETPGVCGPRGEVV